MSDQGAGEFGCASCWPAGADAAWEARQSLGREAELTDEPHFHTMLLVCGACGQRFLSVLIETVDWANGDDPQHWSLLPLTAHEAAELRGGGTAGETTGGHPQRGTTGQEKQRDHHGGEDPLAAIHPHLP